MEIDGKNAVVTGGASGIGRALATALIDRGCKVVIADIDKGALDQTVSELGGAAQGTECNVRDVAAVDQMVEDSWDRLGSVDLAFANAGVSGNGPMIAASPEQFDVIYEVNIRGAWATAAGFARKMIAGGNGGHICITASEHSLGIQHLGAGHYTASKHAVMGWADVMRQELAGQLGISVLCPGLVDTDLHLSNRHSELPDAPPQMQAMGKALMEQGMDASKVAEMCLKGVEDDAFIIATHLCARAGAEKRAQEIEESFAKYGIAGSDKYDVNEAMAKAMAKMGANA